jgi:hypothetical protein
MNLRSFLKSPLWLLFQGFGIGIFITAPAGDATRSRLFIASLALMTITLLLIPLIDRCLPNPPKSDVKGDEKD